MTHCFLNDKELKLVQILNFSLYYNNGENTTCGGIAMYINDKFLHKEWLDLDAFEEEFLELKFCEDAMNKKFKILLSEIYRVPVTSEKNLGEMFAQKMGFVNCLKYSMISLGADHNLDLSKMSQHQNTEVLDICLEYKMIPSIYQTTRVTHS